MKNLIFIDFLYCNLTKETNELIVPAYIGYDPKNTPKFKGYPSVILKKVKGYLGQYNKRKHQITLNILIAHLDKECLDYVVIHELAHIKYMNHSKEFWNHIEKYLPNYKVLRRKCKKEFVYYENY